MQLGLTALFDFLDACPTPALVLATVTRTEGASYRKAGAMMLIDASYNTSGLVSGGCLEDDLKAHAESVFSTGAAKTVVYDLSQEEAASMWGLGLGCGGSIEILLERIDKDNAFGGLDPVRDYFFSGRHCWLHKRIGTSAALTSGHFDIQPGNQNEDFSRAKRSLTTDDATLSIPISPVNRLLVCGAGPDAIPVVALASRLAWQVVVTDPRPAYLNRDLFPDAHQLLGDAPERVDMAKVGPLQAAVIMTHNVERDEAWLRVLHPHPIPYIGLLGPAGRRDMLLERAGLERDSRLFGPAGLDIGAALPDEIALSIVAQLHATLGQRPGGHLPQ